jgi:hypothetical protein
MIPQKTLLGDSKVHFAAEIKKTDTIPEFEHNEEDSHLDDSYDEFENDIYLIQNLKVCTQTMLLTIMTISYLLLSPILAME